LNRLRSISSFLTGLPLTFQRNQSKGLAATYHFTFTGAEERRATVMIRDQRLEVTDGHNGNADIVVTRTAKHGWAFWRRNAILFGLYCAEKSASRDHRDRCWPLENVSRRDLCETRNGELQLKSSGNRQTPITRLLSLEVRISCAVVLSCD